jgi:hypothetical protein
VRANKADPNRVRLILAGQVLEAPPSAVNLQEDYVKFDLAINQGQDRRRWVSIIRAARNADDERINVSVGVPGTEIFASRQAMVLRVYSSLTWGVVAGLLLLLGVLVVLARRTNLLRDTNAGTPGAHPFSLGLVQMAWWFYLAVAGYLYVWLVTGEYNTMTEHVLGLMGISAATGIGAILVDTQKRDATDRRRAALLADEATLQARVTELHGLAPAAGTPPDAELQQKRAELARVQADLAQMPAPHVPAPSRGFVKDVLSDGDGVKLHRLQVAIWTIVLGLVFVKLVYLDLAMPEFNATLLGLMGLSSGTYLGFKFPEVSK